MRKNKTWVVDLFRTESTRLQPLINQVQNDEFWTSDTEAYLNFIVSTQEFVINSAKINLYNKDDGTLVQRDMTIENNEAQYELPQEIIAHFGKWNAQVVFVSGTERYTSPMVDFEVKRTLGDGAPEKLGIIRDWLVFESDAKELIATVEANEQTRKTNEASRIADENIRKANEIQRNDKQIRLKNVVPNGDFSQNTISHFANNGVILAVIDGVLHSTIESSLNASRGFYSSAGNILTNDKIYINFSVKPKHSTIMKFGYDDNRIIVNVVGGAWNRVSGISERKTGTHYTFYVDTTAPGYAVGDADLFDGIVIINLTQTFGAGNEPTKEQMDELLATTGYISGERVVSHQEMFKLISARAKKKQEDWITPTLLNGYLVFSVSDAQPGYYKDTLGNVHIRGIVKGGSGTGALIPILELPSGYRPRNNIFIPVINSGSLGVVVVSILGKVYLFSGTVTSYLSFGAEVIYKAEG